MSNEISIYRRRYNWLIWASTVVFALNVLTEIHDHENPVTLFFYSINHFNLKLLFWVFVDLSVAVFSLLGMFLSLYQFIKPMMILSDINIKTRGLDPYFRTRLWRDIYMVKIRNSGDSKKATLAIYDGPYSYKQYKMLPDDLRRAIEFIATKLPPEKLVFEQKSL